MNQRFGQYGTAAAPQSWGVLGDAASEFEAQYNAWASALDAILAGQRISQAQFNAARAAINAWPGHHAAILGTYIGKDSARAGAERAFKGEALSSKQQGYIREALTWTKIDFGRKQASWGASYEQMELQHEESQIPAAESRYPQTEKDVEAFRQSINHPPPVTGSKRWNNVRQMLQANNFGLLGHLELAYAKDLKGKTRTANVLYGIQGLILAAGSVMSGGLASIPSAIMGAGASGVSAAGASARKQYMAALDTLGSEPYSYGYANHYQIKVPLAVEWAQRKLTSSRSYERDRAATYLKRVGVPQAPISSSPGTAAGKSAPKGDGITPGRVAAGLGLLWLLAIFL